MSNIGEIYTSDEDESFIAPRKLLKARVLDDSDIPSDESPDISPIHSPVSSKNLSASFRNHRSVDHSSRESDKSVASDDDDIISDDDDIIGDSIQQIVVSTPQKPSNSKTLPESQASTANFEADEDIIDASYISQPTSNDFYSKSPEKLPAKREIIDITTSSEDEAPPIEPERKPITLETFLLPKQPLQEPVKQQQPLTVANKRQVSASEYQLQLGRVKNLDQQLSQARNALRTIRLDTLPDKGALLIKKQTSLQQMLQTAREVLENMTINEHSGVNKAPNAYDKVQLTWDQLEAGVGAVAPKTFGKKGIQTFNAQKEMTMEALANLHKSLENCPKESDLVDAPKGLIISLMPHQLRALAWLLWREKQKPAGGILADDMGLGKTLTMISLVIKAFELSQSGDSDSDDDKDKENGAKIRGKFQGGTLVVCPASLLNQWSGEVERRTKRGLLSVEHYHGAKRETKAKILARHDMVITTYSIVMNEWEKKGAVFRVRWNRIILDEAHQIRNHKAKTSEAVCELSAKARWALTGTPVHNKELDMYALLKFLRCSPFDNLQVWKHWVNDKSTGGQERLHTVISSLMLRRTKAELIENGALESMPDRKWELIEIKLQKDEQEVYQRVLIFSRKLFAQFLHQRAEKNDDFSSRSLKAPEANEEYFKMRNHLLKLNKVKEVSQHEILVLLLRLRQICCHPSLITQMLQGDEDLGNAETVEESEEINLLEQLNKMNLNEPEANTGQDVGAEAVNIKEASKGFLNPSHPVFQKNRKSSKMHILIEMVKAKISTGDKAIIISQWTSLLHLIGLQLENEHIKFMELNGSIPVHKRGLLVDNFNDPRYSTRILLLSLTAGGVGLNLVGANHLFLMDLHWNPQLENQAQDRIYRMGQKKSVFIYKFMALDTIEERIKTLQDNKLAIADGILSGSKQINTKLSLQDLKMLFS